MAEATKWLFCSHQKQTNTRQNTEICCNNDRAYAGFFIIRGDGREIKLEAAISHSLRLVWLLSQNIRRE